MKPVGYRSCPILERTGDGRSVGRCWHHCPDDVCPRHGDVSGPLSHYRLTGRLTEEAEFRRSQQPEDS